MWNFLSYTKQFILYSSRSTKWVGKVTSIPRLPTDNISPYLVLAFGVKMILVHIAQTARTTKFVFVKKLYLKKDEQKFKKDIYMCLSTQ